MKGITPAHAGNRKLYFTSACIKKDHPRACGEQCIAWFSYTILRGSPPRMRGTAA
mgnify:CR=1 FL=1